MRTSASGRFSTRDVSSSRLVFSGARVVIALKRWRGRTKQRHRAFEPRAIDGHVAPVVARRFLLLVARLLLLIDDDQAHDFRAARRPPSASRRRRAPRPAARATIRARARRPAARCAAPQRTAPNRARTSRPTQSVSAISGTRTMAVLPRESAASIGAEINFRLAAAGDAMKKRRPRICPRRSSARFPRALAVLLGVQNVRGRREIRVPGVFLWT